jgi:hypothetical protein
LSSKRWAFLGMTLISAISFLVDQVFLSAPESAVADVAAGITGTSEDAPDKPAKKKGVPAANAAPAEVELADPSLPYLDKLPQLSFQRDIFTPSPEMLKYYQALEEQESGGAAVKGPKPNSPAAFEAEHQLQATFSSPEGAMAVIDGKVLRVGSEISGFRLTRIGPYHAEFKRNQDRVQLYIPMPDSQQGKQEAPAPGPTPPPTEEPPKE